MHKTMPSEENVLPERMIGRRWELDALLSKIELLRYGVSSVCSLEGPAGVGKSRMLQEVIAATETLRLQHLLWTARAVPQFRLTPIATIRALRPVLGSDDALSRVELDGTRGDESILATLVTGHVERLCQVRHQTEIVLIIDDAQWMDPVSVAVCRRLLLESPLHVCIVLAARPGRADDGDEIESLLDLREATRIQLQPLRDVEFAKLIHATCPSAGFSHDWISWCENESLGNPLHARALARARASGFLAEDYEAERYSASPDWGSHDSSSRPEIWLTHLSGIAAEGIEVLAAAAILDQNFSLVEVATLAQKPIAFVTENVTNAYQHGLVERVPDNRWRFSHPLLVNMVLQRVDDEYRRSLHLNRARQLVAQNTDSKIELAGHLKHGLAYDKAMDVFLHEAIAAAKLGGNREAATLFRKAEECAKTPEAKLRLISGDSRLIRIRALFAISQYEEAAPLLLEEIDVRNRRRWKELRAWARSGFTDTNSMLERVLEHTRALSTLNRNKVQYSFFANRFRDQTTASVRTMVETLLSKSKTDRGLALSTAGFVLSTFGFKKTAIKALELAGSDIREGWDMPGVLEHLMIYNHTLSQQGRFDEVESNIAASFVWFHRHEVPLQYEMLLAIRSLAHLLRGDIQTAENWHVRCRKSAMSSRNLQAVVWSLSTLTYCREFKQEHDAAIVRELTQLTERTLPAGDRIYALGALALADPAGYESVRWEELVEAIRDNPVGPYYLIVPVDLALAYLNHNIRVSSRTEKRRAALRSLRFLGLMGTTVLATPPMAPMLQVRLAEIFEAINAPRLATIAADRAYRTAKAYNMHLFAQLARIYSPSLSLKARQELIRDLPLNFGANWHSSELQRTADFRRSLI